VIKVDNSFQISPITNGVKFPDGITYRMSIPLDQIDNKNSESVSNVIFIAYFQDTASNIIETPTSKTSNSLPIYYPPAQPTIQLATIAPYRDPVTHLTTQKIWLQVYTTTTNFMPVLTYKPVVDISISTLGLPAAPALNVYNCTALTVTPVPPLGSGQILATFIIDPPADFDYNQLQDNFIAGFTIRQIVIDGNPYPTTYYAKSHLSEEVHLEECYNGGPVLTSIIYDVYNYPACIPRCITGCQEENGQTMTLTWDAPCDYYIQGTTVTSYSISYEVNFTKDHVLTTKCKGTLLTDVDTQLSQLEWPVLLSDLNCELTCGDTIFFAVVANYATLPSRESNVMFESYFEYPEAPTVRLIDVTKTDMVHPTADVTFIYWNPENVGCIDDEDSARWLYIVKQYEDCAELEMKDDQPYVAGALEYTGTLSNIDFTSYTNQKPITLQVCLRVKPPTKDPSNTAEEPESVLGYHTIVDLVPDQEVSLHAFDEQREENHLYFTTISKTQLNYAKILKNGVAEKIRIPEPILENGKYKYYIEHNVSKYTPEDKNIKVLLKSVGNKEKQYVWPWY
jgi:hypothetical protein